MKVLLTITKGEVGGAQIFVANLAKGLKKSNYKINVEIACGYGDFLFNLAREENIFIHKLKSLKRSSGLLSNLAFFFKFIFFLRKNKFDVVHLNSTNTLIGAISSKIANRKTKTVFTVHGLSVLDPNYRASLLKKLLFKSFFKFSFLFVDKIVFVSKKNMELFLKNNECSRDKCFLAYNGVEVDFLSREEARRAIFDKIGRQDQDYFLIGSVGRLSYPKNYEFLIYRFPEILKINPKAKLVILGDGPERGKYIDIIAKNNLEGSIFMPGELESASRYLKGLDMFILPSIYEGLSISLIEVLFSGIKVVASKVGGNEEIIGADNCYKLDNKADFIRVFEKVLNNEQNCCTDKNRRNIDKNRFLIRTMVDKYVDIYNS
jgi:glycosyltransferase involved in cell wall biosynthesis